MISKDKTAYPIFYSSYTDKELNVLFKPTNDELQFVQNISKVKSIQFLTLLSLKNHQYLGYFPEYNDIPYSILSFVKTNLKFHSKFTISFSERSQRRVKVHILNYLQVKTYQKRKPLWF